MGDDGTTTWKINVTNAIAKEDNRFVLRLKPHTSPAKYTDTLNQASGVGITIQPSSNQESSSQSSSASSTLSTATSTKATSATTSTTATTTTTPPPATENTTENTTVKKKKKTSIGPIVGGVLGGLIVLILILVIALLLLRKKKRSNNVGKGASELAAGDALMAPQYGEQEVKYAHNQPLAGGYVAPAELADTHETRPGQGFAHELPAAAPGDGGDWRR
jgi:ATP-dependent Zn protease